MSEQIPIKSISQMEDLKITSTVNTSAASQRAPTPNYGSSSTIHGSRYIRNMSHSIRNNFIACCGEFIGTTLFLFFGLAGAQVANNNPLKLATKDDTIFISSDNDPSQLLYISLVFAFSLAVNVWVFYRISGGLFNPAVTLALTLSGAIPWFRAILFVPMQLAGGIVASAIVSGLFQGELSVNTTLNKDTSTVQGLFIEMFLTFELVFTIFMLAAEKHKATFLGPVAIGLALFIAHMVGISFTGSSLNPARSFGPAVVTGVWPSYHWIYWLGPVMGALLATGLYKVLKIVDYTTANPGQDDHFEKSDRVRPRSQEIV